MISAVCSSRAPTSSRTSPSPSPSSAPTSSISFSLLRNTKTLEVAFLLSKAIYGCDKSDLTSLLRSAAKSGNSYFVSALIDAGADLNHRDSNGQSMMSLAIQSGNTDSIQILIDSGFVIDNSIDWLLHDTAAAAAIDQADLMEDLCLGFREIAVNFADFRGRTTLHVAAIRGHVDSLQFLVSISGDPDLVDHNGWILLHCAAAEGHHEAAEFLIDHSTFSKYVVNREGKTSFALSVEKGHSHLYDLLQLGDSLQQAARIDDIHAMKSCLAEGGRVNGRDQNGWTPLHRAAFKGRVESVKLLLSHGAQVDVVDDSGYTLLQRAVEGRHLQVVMCLVDHGAKANLKSIKGVDIIGSFNMDYFKNHPSLVAPLCQEKERA